jgi:hypothetical protein
VLFAVPALFAGHETAPTTLISQLIHRITPDYQCQALTPADVAAGS